MVTVVYNQGESPLRQHVVEILGWSRAEDANAMVEDLAVTLLNNGVTIYRMTVPSKSGKQGETEHFIFSFAHVKEFRLSQSSAAVYFEDTYSMSFAMANSQGISIALEMVTKYGAYLKARV